jgi:hypothetical protein
MGCGVETNSESEQVIIARENVRRWLAPSECCFAALVRVEPTPGGQKCKV